MAGAEPRTGLRPWHWVLVGLAVLILKQGYAQAGAGQLQWLLAPLAGVLNLAGGLAFAPQPDGTWLDAGHRVLLVKACAGGNFLLTAWLAWLWRLQHRTAPRRAVITAAAAAWVTTLAANALRILLAVHGQDVLARLGGLSPAETHRLLGIAVYFASLSLVLARPGRLHTALVTAAGLYLGVNLVVPALRAAWLGLPGLDPAHLAWTAGVPLAVIGLSLMVRRARAAGPVDLGQGSRSVRLAAALSPADRCMGAGLAPVSLPFTRRCGCCSRALGPISGGASGACRGFRRCAGARR